MRSGKLRNRIKIQRLVKSDDPFEQADRWVDVGPSMWSAIEPLTSKSTYQVGEQSMKVSHKVTIRYPGLHVSISAGNRVVYKTRILEIQTGLMNVNERDREVELLAYEIDPTL